MSDLETQIEAEREKLQSVANDLEKQEKTISYSTESLLVRALTHNGELNYLLSKRAHNDSEKLDRNVESLNKHSKRLEGLTVVLIGIAVIQIIFLAYTVLR